MRITVTSDDAPNPEGAAKRPASTSFETRIARLGVPREGVDHAISLAGELEDEELAHRSRRHYGS